MEKTQEKAMEKYIKENKIKFPLNPRETVKLTLLVMVTITEDGTVKQFLQEQLKEYDDLNLPKW